MRRLGVFALLAGASAASLAYACTSDDGGGGSGTFGGADSSFESGSGSSGTSGSSGGGDDGGPGDAGSDGGGGIKGPIGSCTPLQRIDSMGSVSVFGMTASSFAGKYLFTWNESNAESHFRGRYFDGTKLTDEIDFGPGLAEPYTESSVSPTGKAYVMWTQSGTDANLAEFDLPTGAVVSSTYVPMYNSYKDFGVAALPGGGALLEYQVRFPSEMMNVETFGATTGLDAGMDAGAYSTANIGDEADIALNSAGKGAAFWSFVSGGNVLNVLPYDGTQTGTLVTRAFAQGASHFSAAALANGDIAFVWASNQATSSLSIFHPGATAGSEWDPDLQLGAATATHLPSVLVGPNDAITVLWVESGVQKMQRRLGGVWSTAVGLGASPNGQAVAALDPGGNVVFVLGSGTQTVSVGRVPADSTAAPPVVTLGLDGQGSAIAFDSAGDPVIGGVQVISAGASYFTTSTCTTAP